VFSSAPLNSGTLLTRTSAQSAPSPSNPLCGYMKACTACRNCMRAPPELLVELQEPYGLRTSVPTSVSLECVGRKPLVGSILFLTEQPVAIDLTALCIKYPRGEEVERRLSWCMSRNFNASHGSPPKNTLSSFCLSRQSQERSESVSLTDITSANATQLESKHRKLAPFRKYPHHC